MTNLSQQEQERRRNISLKTREMVETLLDVEQSDDTSIMLNYNDFYLQLSFSQAHPLLVIYLAHGLPHEMTAQDACRINEINLRSVLGSHAINNQVGCYSYRATHWLDVPLHKKRFLEILNRSIDEANRGYALLIA